MKNKLGIIVYYCVYCAICISSYLNIVKIHCRFTLRLLMREGLQWKHG